ncbi:SMP-30/gluconolactonase/LRE family protein [Flavobacteriaceae bacterium M23B6Z8]
MKKYFPILLLLLLANCKQNKSTENTVEKTRKETAPTAELVAEFNGQQVTGVTVSEEGQIFANFPRWREGVKYSVVEVNNSNTKPYPNEKWNSWKLGDALQDSVFVAVQSVVAFKDRLYVLDTRNPLFQGVQGAPRVYVFNLNNDALDNIYIFNEEGFHPDSYINDLRIDGETNRIYFTDSGHAGLVVLNLETGKTHRVLDNHYSTLAETDSLSIDGKTWKNRVHSDGIALDTENNLLYYHALTGYTLYTVPTRVLSYGTASEVEKSVLKVKETPAPDGMIFDQQGNLYLADLERHKIMRLDPEGNLSVLIEGEKVSWADTFSIYNNELYYTNSKIHLAKADVSELSFSVYKILIE